MIYVIETMNPGDKHLMVNNGLIDILLQNKQNDMVKFYGDAGQIAFVRSLTDNNRLLSRPIKVQGNPRLYLIPFIVVYHLWIITGLLFKCRKGKNLLVFTYLFPVTHFCTKLLKRLFPKAKVIIALHGELEYTNGEKKPVIKLLARFLIAGFRIRCDKNTRYLVYGASIRLNMIKETLVRENEVIAIDHPYNYEDADISPAPDDDKFTGKQRLSLGTVGLAVVKKKSHYLFELASRLREKGYGADKVSFTIVGTLVSDMYPYVNQFVSFKDKDGFWERSEYEAAAKEMDYIVFFYDNEGYKFTASGAFFDAIKFGKPILCLHNDFMDHYFRKFGNIGRTFPTLEAMTDYLVTLLDNEEQVSTQYFQQRQAVLDARKSLQTSNIALDFWNNYQ